MPFAGLLLAIAAAGPTVGDLSWMSGFSNRAWGSSWF